jgi:hypothetical protein
MDLNTAANWDTVTPTDYTAPVTRAGKDFYIYACLQAGTTPKILLSANSTYPSGYTANNSRKIGGFHCMPLVMGKAWTADTATVANFIVRPTTPDATYQYIYKCTARAGDYKTDASTEPTWPTTVGATVVDDQITWTCMANATQNLPAGHPYINFEMGAILFNSTWDLLDRPRATPEGMTKISLSPSDGSPALWVDIYLASGTGTAITSVYGAAIKDTTSWNTFSEYGTLQKKRFLVDQEFKRAVHGSNAATNIAGSADPVNAYHSVDTAGRSMISWYGVIGAAGIVWQFLQDSMFLVEGADVAAIETWAQASMTYGSVMGQGSHQGDGKVIAGGKWNSGAQCGSEGRSFEYRRVAAYDIIGARFASDPI